jgi:hypothetical protein
MFPPTPEQEALATRLVDEALRDMKHALPPEGLELLREFLIDDMLCTEEGMRRLQALEAPAIVLPDFAPPAKKE